jgi:serine phosphatase RsbU (regulator of sigma subunit)
MMACMEVWGGNRAIDNGVMMPGMDAWVYSRPFAKDSAESAEAGGDLHYVSSCASGRITRLIVADVSGHGAPVAKAAEALRRLMRKHSNYIDQTRLVEAVNREFGEIGEEASSGGNDVGAGGAMFATAVVATYFSPTDALAVSNAGHPRPMWYDARARTWSKVESTEPKGPTGPTNLPLGVLAESRYPAAAIRLRPDDLVLFYTDSLIEAKDSSGRLLGQEGLRRILAEIDPTRPEVFVGTLLERIARESGTRAFDDDVTALLVRRNALKPQPSVGLAMLSGYRILREAARSILPGGLPASWPQINIASIGGSFFQRLNGSSREQSPRE